MLSEDQLFDFHATGIVRVPGAVPATDAAAMVDRIWAHLADDLRIIRRRPDPPPAPGVEVDGVATSPGL